MTQDPAPFDYGPAAASIGTILGGLVAGLLAVLGAALVIRALWWGIPKIISFFTGIAAGYDEPDMVDFYDNVK